MDFFLSTILDPADFQGIYTRLNRVMPLLGKRNWDSAFVRALEKLHALSARASWKFSQEKAASFSPLAEEIHKVVATLRNFMQLIDSLMIARWPDAPERPDRTALEKWCLESLGLLERKATIPCVLAIDGYSIWVAVDQLPSPYLIELAGLIRTLAADYELSNLLLLPVPSRIEGITLREVRDRLLSMASQVRSQPPQVEEAAPLDLQSFPVKQRKLLETLHGNGGMPMAAVLQKVYGSAAKSKQTALLKLKDRVNAGLVKKRLPFAIAVNGDSLSLDEL